VDADKIVVLSDGEIVEQGSHNQLLDKGGHYAALWQAQQGVQA
jgi:ATP-binding cassette subfamily B protein